MTIDKCKHKFLTFGSGGYYVICLDCGCYWMALKYYNWNKGDTEASNNGLTLGDIRTTPESKTSIPHQSNKSESSRMISFSYTTGCGNTYYFEAAADLNEEVYLTITDKTGSEIIKELSIPGDAILGLVANYIRAKKIDKLKLLTSLEILGIEK